MVVSQNKGTPIYTSKYYSPFIIGTPRMVPLIFGNLRYKYASGFVGKMEEKMETITRKLGIDGAGGAYCSRVPY